MDRSESQTDYFNKRSSRNSCHSLQNYRQMRPSSNNAQRRQKRQCQPRFRRQTFNNNNNNASSNCAIRINGTDIECPMNNLSSSLPATFRVESDLPGFSFDPITKKYYKILPNQPGQPVGSTLKELNYIKQQNERLQMIEKLSAAVSHSGMLRATTSKSSLCGALPNVLRNLELGCTRANFSGLLAKRNLEDQRLRQVLQTPSYNFDVIDEDLLMGGRFTGCQFLDVKEDGKTLIGCWSDSVTHSSQSRIVSYNIGVNSTEAQQNSRLQYSDELKLDTKGKCSLNTYGLRFEPMENDIFVESTLIDMLLAPADSDVTCIVYATANSFYDSDHRIVTSCRVFLKPVEQLTKEEGKESMTSPIYNAEWRTKEPIWSCAFNSNHMRIGIGMEKYATIFDVLTGQNFRVSSGGRNVIAQQYSKDGNILHLGRRNANMASLDLRMSNNHIIGEFYDSLSTCFIHRMESQQNYILTDNFDGKIKLWDARMRRCVLNFNGHKNRSHKVPCFVDDDEHFIFAVGEDGVARGWSLNSGELLCSIVCPRSDPPECSDFPRVVYSDCWGGVNGNSAILIAANGDIYVHELLL